MRYMPFFFFDAAAVVAHAYFACAGFAVTTPRHTLVFVIAISLISLLHAAAIFAYWRLLFRRLPLFTLMIFRCHVRVVTFIDIFDVSMPLCCC